MTADEYVIAHTPLIKHLVRRRAARFPWLDRRDAIQATALDALVAVRVAPVADRNQVFFDAVNRSTWRHVYGEARRMAKLTGGPKLLPHHQQTTDDHTRPAASLLATWLETFPARIHWGWRRRLVAYLRHVEQMPVHEIAGLFGVNARTFNRWVQHTEVEVAVSA